MTAMNPHIPSAPLKPFLWDCAREGGGRYPGWGFVSSPGAEPGASFLEPGLSPCAAPDLG